MGPSAAQLFEAGMACAREKSEEIESSAAWIAEESHVDSEARAVSAATAHTPRNRGDGAGMRFEPPAHLVLWSRQHLQVKPDALFRLMAAPGFAGLKGLVPGNGLLRREGDEVAAGWRMEELGCSTVPCFEAFHGELAVQWATRECQTSDEVVRRVLGVDRDRSTVKENAPVADDSNLYRARLLSHIGQVARKQVGRECPQGGCDEFGRQPVRLCVGG